MFSTTLPPPQSCVNYYIEMLLEELNIENNNLCKNIFEARGCQARCIMRDFKIVNCSFMFGSFSRYP